MQERFKLISAVYLIPVKDGKILLSRRFQTGYEDGNYGLVAGHVDGEETMKKALVREVKEEIGILLDPSKLKLVLTMHRWCGDHERIDLFFTADQWDGEIKNMEPHRCDDLQWFPLEKLPDNTIPYIHTAIDCYLKGVSYYELGWENK